VLQRGAKYFREFWMLRKMRADRRGRSRQEIGQLPGARLLPGKSFRGGKTTSVFEFAPEEDRQWFARGDIVVRYH